MPHLAHIRLYPVKSLDGLAVAEAVVLPSGALEHDRQFAIVDAEGRYVNGKRTAQVHRVCSTFDVRTGTLELGAQGHDHRQAFSVDTDRAAIDAWLSGHFGFPVTLIENTVGGFPDDTDSPGPTFLSTATLSAVATWFPGLDTDQCRVRFRANLEIGGVEAFWEDRLFGAAGAVVRFRVGAVVFEGVNPCQRCVVPGRAPTSGAAIADFPRQFERQRRATLPPWAVSSRFNHFYRLAVNTRLAQGVAGTIRVGDAVEILEAVG